MLHAPKLCTPTICTFNISKMKQNGKIVMQIFERHTLKLILKDYFLFEQIFCFRKTHCKRIIYRFI